MAKETVQKGDKLKVDYEGSLESGEIFDSSVHGDHSHPLEFEAGSRQVIAGFDQAVIGMKIGEEKKIKINSEEAYGQYRKDLIMEIPRSSLPKDQEIKEGMIVLMASPDGRQFPAKITKIEKDKAEVDLNHPLAGKSLIFKIKVIAIS